MDVDYDDGGDDFVDDAIDIEPEEEPQVLEDEPIQEESEEVDVEEEPDEEVEPDEDSSTEMVTQIIPIEHEHKPDVEIPGIDTIVPVLETLEQVTTPTKYPFLTKYEYARIIGLRSSQISQGAKLYIQLTQQQRDLLGKMVYADKLIAEWELAQRKLPFIIRRQIPTTANSNSAQFIRLNSLIY